jgi:4-oxalocrotonate tautomerase
MSFVSIKIAGPTLAPEQVRRLQEQVASIAIKTISAAPELTAVLVKQVAVQGWSVGAAPLRVAAHIEAKVASGFAASEQKGGFVAEANALLKRVLGAALPVASYVVGYGGLTLAQRQRTERPLHAARSSSISLMLKEFVPCPSSVSLCSRESPRNIFTPSRRACTKH